MNIPVDIFFILCAIYYCYRYNIMRLKCEELTVKLYGDPCESVNPYPYTSTVVKVGEGLNKPLKHMSIKELRHELYIYEQLSDYEKCAEIRDIINSKK